jgi:hypothetical protein
MEPEKLEHYLTTALKEPEIRRACYALESIIRGGLILDDLSPRCLEFLQGRCEEYEKEQHGTEHEFKRAWMAMVAEHLADAKLRERRLHRALTGEAGDGEG